jgi:hypothetical protein
MDVWDETSQSFQSVAIPSPSNGRDVSSDNALPPLYGETTVTFHVFLDLENPLSVPRWVKTGDVDDWLQTMFGASAMSVKGVNGKQDEGSDSTPTRGWEGKITVVDPDPVRKFVPTLDVTDLALYSSGPDLTKCFGDLGNKLDDSPTERPRTLFENASVFTGETR